MTEKHDPLREDDRRIDAVLHALTQVEPGETMQARLLASLRPATHTNGEQADATALRWLPSFTFASSPARMAWTACLLAVVGASLHHAALRGSAPLAARSTGTIAAAAPQLAGNRPATARRGTIPLQQERTGASTAMLKSEPAAATTTVHSSHSAIFASGSGSIHVQKADAASVPPPPLPLTEQERLLLRIGRRESAEQLALLTLPARNAAFQQEKDAVTEFFAPAPPLRSQGEASPEEPGGQP